MVSLFWVVERKEALIEYVNSEVKLGEVQACLEATVFLYTQNKPL